MAKVKNTISSFWNKDSVKSPELMIRESYLRAVKDILDSFGVESYSVERIQGMTQMLEQFTFIQKENE